MLNPIIREKLKEATQSERLAMARKNAMASFFTKKSEKTTKKSDDSSNEKTDSLILFSGVDLLFNGYDEAGFRFSRFFALFSIFLTNKSKTIKRDFGEN